MHALFPYLIALHQQELLEQAELQRRAKLSTASQPRTPAWRRTLGGLLHSAARSLDPSVEVDHSAALPAGRGANPLPAC
jgi:hypothetical protein